MASHRPVRPGGRHPLRGSAGKGLRRGKVAGAAKAGPFRSIGDSLGLREDSVTTVIERIQAGFPFRCLDVFQKSTKLSIEAIAALVRIPPRTLTRRKAAGKLRPDESERLLRASTVVDKAVRLFEGDRVAAIQWLQTPQPGLGGNKPLEYARTEVGARAVEDLIGRLEHGVFA